MNAINKHEYHLKLEAELYETRQFIARMISEYKAQLVKYVEQAQAQIDKCAGVQRELCAIDYWLDELGEAMRRLNLNDAELMPLINPLNPCFLTALDSLH